MRVASMNSRFLDACRRRPTDEGSGELPPGEKEVRAAGLGLPLFVKPASGGSSVGVTKVKDWRREIGWADVVVFDDVLGNMGAMADEVRAAGKPVIGGSPYSDRLEADRAFGQQELKAVGVPIIPHENFTSFDEAVTYVQENPNRYVIKPSGEAQNIKRLLFVGEEDDGRDVIQVLNDYKRFWSDKVKEFQLQRRILGVEVAVGAFFNGKEFVTPVCVNFEHKKLFPGDIGPPTGEMGTSMFWSEPNRLFNATLKKMEGKLAEARYTGYVSLEMEGKEDPETAVPKSIAMLRRAFA